MALSRPEKQALLGVAGAVLLGLLGVAAWVTLTAFYWGPIDPEPDHGAEIMALGFAATGRSPEGNAEDWDRWVGLFEDLKGVQDLEQSEPDWPQDPEYGGPLYLSVGYSELFPTPGDLSEPYLLPWDEQIELTKRIIDRHESSGHYRRLEHLIRDADERGDPIMPHTDEISIDIPGGVLMPSRQFELFAVGAMIGAMEGDWDRAVRSLRLGYGMSRLLTQQNAELLHVLGYSGFRVCDRALMHILVDLDPPEPFASRLIGLRGHRTRSLSSVLEAAKLIERSLVASMFEPESRVIHRNQTLQLRAFDHVHEFALDIRLGRATDEQIQTTEDRFRELGADWRHREMAAVITFRDAIPLWLSAELQRDMQVSGLRSVESLSRITPLFLAIERHRREHGSPPATLEDLGTETLDALDPRAAERAVPLPPIVYEVIDEHPGYRLGVERSPSPLPAPANADAESRFSKPIGFVPIPHTIPGTWPPEPSP